MRQATLFTPSAPLAASAAAGASATRWQGLAPVVSARTRVLVLGSFPGLASLRAGQYYGHPQNKLWKILAALWPQHPMPPAGDGAAYAARCAWLLDRGLGLWDVYASCEREGSLDSRIRHAQVNDFAQLARACPALALLAHNGGKSFKHAKAVQASLVQGGTAALTAVQLPSTSPAHASWSFERKLAAWAAVMSDGGLL